MVPIIFWLLPIACLASITPGSPNRPNIIFILADDMGWNDAGYHGGEIPTPNLDALGYQGVILNRHYTAPICTPSRASFLTGKYPSNTGLQGPPPIGAGSPVGLPLEEKLLPQYLKELGYSTHLVGKWHLGSYLLDYTPTRRGFDTHFGFWNGYVGHYDGIHSKELSGFTGVDFHRQLEPAWNESYGRYITDVITDEAVRLIRNHGSKSGMFLYLAHAAPHTGNPRDTLNMEPPIGRGLGQRARNIRDPKRRICADVLKVLDESIGRVVTELSRADMLDNSIITFISDNGAPSVDLIYGYGNGGSNWPLRGEKLSSHEGGIRVNAVAWSPLFKNPGRVSHQLFHMADWLPTLVTAAGGKSRNIRSIDGVDQWEALTSGNSLPARSTMLADLNSYSESIFSGPWKLVKDFPTTGDGSNYTSADYFLGISGRGVNAYNVTEVWSSPTAVETRRAQDCITAESTYLKLRDEASVKCPGRPTGAARPCNPNYCLFHIEDDPCEIRDLARLNPDIVDKLKELIQPYKARARPKLMAPTDPRSNPACFGNNWVAWQDPVYSTQSTCGITSTHSIDSIIPSSLSLDHLSGSKSNRGGGKYSPEAGFSHTVIILFLGIEFIFFCVLMPYTIQTSHRRMEYLKDTLIDSCD